MKKTFLKYAAAALCCSMMATSFTACTEDEEDDAAEIAEQFNLDYLTAKANNDGTITISGTVTTNKKLKKFVLTAEDGTECDLLKDSESEKERTEDGKTWTATLASSNIPVGIYTLEVRTRMGTTKKTTVGKAYTFEAGTSKNDTLGSYLSFSTQAEFTIAEAPANLDVIEAVLKDDKNGASSATPTLDDIYIETIQKAKSGTISAATNEAHVYPNCIITSTDCIATYSLDQDDSDPTHITISGIVMTSSDSVLKIDVSGETWDK